MARMAPSTAAPPAMSYFIFSMPSAGLIEMPPVSKVTPLPTSPRWAPRRLHCRRVAEDDQRGRLGAAHGDPEQRAHAELPHAVLVENFAFEAVLSGGHRSARARRTARGVRRLAGSLTSSRAKFWASAIISAAL